MKKLTFEPTEIIAEQLAELSRITQRPIGELINEILAPALNQMVEDQDTDYMQLVLDGVEYDEATTVAAVAENINTINWETVMEHGQFHVHNAWAGDDRVVHFGRLELVKSSDFDTAPGK